MKRKCSLRLPLKPPPPNLASKLAYHIRYIIISVDNSDFFLPVIFLIIPINSSW